jgi:hypothetical protein
MINQPSQDNKDADQTLGDSPEYREYLDLKLEDVSKQIKDEYKVAEKFMRSKRETWGKYSKL